MIKLQQKNNSYIKLSKEDRPFYHFEFIDFWSIIYIAIVYIVTLIMKDANAPVYVIYFLGAIPFIKHVDKYAIICFILSTLAYYFVGADEGVWSIYTILATLLILRIIIDFKIWKVNILPFLCIGIAIILSFMHSEFGYVTGMYAMLYNIIIAMLVCTTVEIQPKTLSEFLPRMAAVQIIAYIIILIVNGYFDGFGLTVSSEVNHNTFGTAVSILSVILFIKVQYFNGDYIYRGLWILSLALTVIAGSRNALLAMVITSILMYMIIEKHKGNSISGIIKLVLASCLILFLGIVILPEYNFDLSRYDYVTLISSGGTNRSTIWETLAPVIWEQYRWFGYGPSHYCSELIMTPLIHRVYTHTHNTFFEAWGELGIVGLVPFIWLIWIAIKKCLFFLLKGRESVLLSALLIEFLFVSLGESLFADIELWLLISFIFSPEKIKLINNY